MLFFNIIKDGSTAVRKPFGYCDCWHIWKHSHNAPGLFTARRLVCMSGKSAERYLNCKSEWRWPSFCERLNEEIGKNQEVCSCVAHSEGSFQFLLCLNAVRDDINTLLVCTNTHRLMMAIRTLACCVKSPWNPIKELSDLSELWALLCGLRKGHGDTTNEKDTEGKRQMG